MGDEAQDFHFPGGKFDAKRGIVFGCRFSVQVFIGRHFLPEFFNGILLAVSWTYLVIAEIVASSTGIGAMMMRAKRFLHTDSIMAGIVVIGILGLMFDFLFKTAHRRLFPYIVEGNQ